MAASTQVRLTWGWHPTERFLAPTWMQNSCCGLSCWNWHSFSHTNPTDSDPKNLTAYLKGVSHSPWTKIDRKKELCSNQLCGGSSVESPPGDAFLEGAGYQSSQSPLRLLYMTLGSFPSAQCSWPFKGNMFAQLLEGWVLWEKCISEHAALYWSFQSMVVMIHVPASG